MDTFTLPELHRKMQSIYECAQLAKSLNNFLPEMASFAKELLNNPIFNDILQTATKHLKDDLNPILELKKHCYKELITTRKLLTTKAKDIPTLSVYLHEYDNIMKTRPKMSFELIIDLEALIIRICLFLKLSLQSETIRHGNKSNKHSIALLKQLATIDGANTIIEYIFAPSLRLLHNELAIFERTKKTALWYSIYILSNIYALNDLKNFEQRYYSLLLNNQQTAAYLFKISFHQFDAALEPSNSNNSHDTNIDIYEYKIHLHRVWTTIQPTLLTKEDAGHAIGTNTTLTYRYTKANDLRQGVLSDGKTTLKLVGNSAEILHLALKKKNISSDEAGEQLPDGRATPKGRVNNALRVIKNNVLKKFEIPEYISSKYSIISVNYPTIPIK